MSRRAKNMVRLVANLARNGWLSRRVIERQFPRAMFFQVSGQDIIVQIGNRIIRLTALTPRIQISDTIPAGTRIRISDTRTLSGRRRGNTASLRINYNRGAQRDVTVTTRQGDASFPLPLPAGWRYPQEVAGVIDISVTGSYR